MPMQTAENSNHYKWAETWGVARGAGFACCPVPQPGRLLVATGFENYQRCYKGLGSCCILSLPSLLIPYAEDRSSLRFMIGKINRDIAQLNREDATAEAASRHQDTDSNVQKNIDFICRAARTICTQPVTVRPRHARNAGARIEPLAPVPSHPWPTVRQASFVASQGGVARRPAQ